jgi:folylpolyglutamate synthase
MLNIAAIPEMKDYLTRIGYTPQDLNRLNVIHISGTKGKGSTSAFCSSILSEVNIGTDKRKLKIGLSG